MRDSIQLLVSTSVYTSEQTESPRKPESMPHPLRRPLDPYEILENDGTRAECGHLREDPIGNASDRLLLRYRNVGWSAADTGKGVATSNSTLRATLFTYDPVRRIGSTVQSQCPVSSPARYKREEESSRPLGTHPAQFSLSSDRGHSRWDVIAERQDGEDSRESGGFKDETCKAGATLEPVGSKLPFFIKPGVRPATPYFNRFKKCWRWLMRELNRQGARIKVRRKWGGGARNTRSRSTRLYARSPARNLLFL